jgi:hypothetical protein
VLNLLNGLLKGFLADRELHKDVPAFLRRKRFLANVEGRGKEFGWEK